MNTRKTLVVGHGIVGHRFVKAAIERGLTETHDIVVGEELAYGELVLAAGAARLVPPVPGVEKQNDFVYRTIEDLEAIAAAARTATSGARG